MRNPITGLEEDEELVQQVPPAQPAWNHSVKDYLLKKRAEREQLQNSINEESSGPNIAAGLAAIGAGFQGKDSLAAGQNFLANQNAQRKQRLTDFDAANDKYIKENEIMVDADKKQRESDPNSVESKMANELAASMGYKGGPITAAQFKEFSPIMQKKYELAERALDRKEARDERRFQQGIRMDDKKIAREEKLAEKAKPSDKQIETFTDFENADSDLQNMLNLLGDNKNYVGPIDGRVPDMLVGDGQIAFRSAVGKYKDAYRKAITGAGAGPTEIAMLEKRLPSENDSPAAFKAKALEAQKELARRKETLASNLTKGGKNVSKFVDSGKPKTIKVSNGSETLEIPVEDLADAQRDGFSLVGSTAGAR